MTTDRFTIPASLIEDARAHPEKYRPEVEVGDRVLLFGPGIPPGLLGQVIYHGPFTSPMGGEIVTIEDSNGTRRMGDAWLRVGGVEQGPRPDVDGRVIALAGAVSTGIWIVTSYTDGGGLLASQPMKPNEEVFITEWALLPEADDDEHVIPDECTEPCDHASIGEQRVRRSSIHPRGIGKPTVEDDGMGEATAATEARKPLQPGRMLVTDPDDLKRLRELRRNVDADLDHWREHGTKRPRERTVGSLGAADIGRWVEVEGAGITSSGWLLSVDHHVTDGVARTHLTFRPLVDELSDYIAANSAAPCKVSDEAGETT